MKVLYVGLEYVALRSGQREKSFEDVNFYQSLARLPGITLDYYKLDPMREVGEQEVSRRIRDHVMATKPDALFLFMNHDLDKEVFREISRHATTVAFFSDEDTDLYVRSIDWIGVFDWIVTFYPPAFEEYRSRGLNVIGANWAANTDFWKPFAGDGVDVVAGAYPKAIEVSFVGAAKDERRVFIKNLLKRGVVVDCYGAGWPNGPVSFERMREIIATSKINLNLGFAKPILQPRTLARIFISPNANSTRSRYRLDIGGIGRNIKTILNRRRPQSRARPFELAASGAFVLTNRSAPLFGEPFIPDKEMVYYDDVRDAARKIRYYLAPEHAAEREAIAAAGYARTVRDHSFEKRFTDVLAIISSVGPKPKMPVAKLI